MLCSAQPSKLEKKKEESTCKAGPYYPLGTTGTVPRAYDMFRAYEGMEGRKMKSRKM
jgi:hypothetical protein